MVKLTKLCFFELFFFALKLGKGGQNFLGGSECGASELRGRANSCPAELLWQEKRVPKLAREVYAELPDNDLQNLLRWSRALKNASFTLSKEQV